MQDRKRTLRCAPTSQPCPHRISPCSPAFLGDPLTTQSYTNSLRTAQRALCLLFLGILSLVLRGLVVHSWTSDLIAKEEQIPLLYGRNIRGSRVWQCSRFVSKAVPALVDWMRDVRKGKSAQASFTALLYSGGVLVTLQVLSRDSWESQGLCAEPKRSTPAGACR
jgi:hypothetical protein